MAKEQVQAVFRKKSLDRVNSPEQLNEYIRVANPGVWVILAAVIVLLRYVLVYSTVNAVRKRLGEKHIMATYFLYDLFGVWVDIALAASRRIYKDDTVWR